MSSRCFAAAVAASIDRTLDAGAKVERLLVQLDPAGFDLGEVQDVVDDRQQRIARRPDSLGIVALLVGQRCVEHEPAHPDDRVHRRADLVAHRGEERALRPVGILRGIPGPSASR